jgi:RNA polymerase sigma-70 factor, ECF subfamily
MSLDLLLSDLRNGDPTASERLLTLVQQTVYSFGMKVCGGEPEDAKDTMQDTLLKVYQSLPELQFDNSQALKVWLYKVAKNACLMMRRKSKFEPQFKIPISSAEDVPDIAKAPLDVLLKSELRESVQAAIRQLPYSNRLVLVLRDLEQLSTKETAEVLGTTEENVKIRLHRARAKLRSFLRG